MTYEQAMHFWFGRVNYEVKSPRPSDLSLDRMRAALHLLGDPQKRFRIIHVAGTKGKGSTAAMLESILSHAGYRTGLFTSPHLVRVEERIQVERTPITPDELTQLMTDIQTATRKGGLDQTLTFFEIGTALGFLHFARRRVDVALVEVGLGGRFDSTNVCRPFLSVITSISFDHTQQLGDKLALIAMEKAGIVKPGRPTVSGVRAPEARVVIENICRERGSPLREIEVDYRYRYQAARIGAGQGSAGQDRPGRVTISSDRQEWPAMDVGLIGEHQARNAALAVAAVENLRDEGLAIPDAAVAAGLAGVRWPARLEIVARQPLVILDCAHNVASAEALVAALAASLPRPAGGRWLLVFAASRDKDMAGIIRVLAPRFDHIYLTRYTDATRGAAPEDLAKLLPAGDRVSVCPTAADAWQQARAAAGADDMICITGSVFLAGELRPLFVSDP